MFKFAKAFETETEAKDYVDFITSITKQKFYIKEQFNKFSVYLEEKQKKVDYRKRY